MYVPSELTHANLTGHLTINGSRIIRFVLRRIISISRSSQKGRKTMYQFDHDNRNWQTDIDEEIPIDFLIEKEMRKRELTISFALLSTSE